MRNYAQEKLPAAERRRQALDLRRTGATFRQIADTLGVTQSTAHKYVATEIDRLNAASREDAERVRTLEADRLDRALLSIWPQVTRGNFGAIDRMIRIMERRARLLGLDAPNKFSPTNPEGDGPAEGGAVAILPPTAPGVDEWLKRYRNPDNSDG